MLGAGSAFIIATVTFFLYAFIARQEFINGRRIFLAGIRNRLDGVLEWGYVALRARAGRLYRLTIKLSWYYSIHSTLRTLLTFLIRVYDRIEAVFNANRERAKALRAEKKALVAKTHLTEIKEHKDAVALSPREKKKLKDKTLEHG